MYFDCHYYMSTNNYTDLDQAVNGTSIGRITLEDLVIVINMFIKSVPLYYRL